MKQARVVIAVCSYSGIGLPLNVAHRGVLGANNDHVNIVGAFDRLPEVWSFLD